MGRVECSTGGKEHLMSARRILCECGGLSAVAAAMMERGWAESDGSLGGPSSAAHCL